MSHFATQPPSSTHVEYVLGDWVKGRSGPGKLTQNHRFFWHGEFCNWLELKKNSTAILAGELPDPYCPILGLKESMRRKPVQVATIILAGGQGTRLHPLTLHHSKPAVSYGGRYRLIDIPISNSINSGFGQIFVIAQYLSDELQHHISQTYNFDHYNPGSVDVLTPERNEKGEQEWFTGSADAVRKKLPTLLKSSADYFLILCGDQLYNINFQSMIDFVLEVKADLAIASLPVHEKEARRMGVLKIDQKRKIQEFYEKPTTEELLTHYELDDDFFSHHKIKAPKERCFLGSMGIYIFHREALVSLLKSDEGEDFGKHIIKTAVERENSYSYIYNGYWEDIGTVASYYDANLILTKSNDGLNTYDETNPIYTRPTYLPGPKIRCTKITQSIICEGSIVEADEITNCVIGLRSHIKRGTIMRDSIMMGNHFYMPPTSDGKSRAHNFWIGENCLIEKAIIDEHVQIGNHVKLINKDKLTHYDGDGIFIRDGIIIVTAGTEIPDHYIL